MHRNTIVSSFLGVFLIFLACSELPGIGAAPKIENTTLMYAMPRTRISVQVTVTRTLIKKGPYSDFAEKMLGIKSVAQKDTETWSIDDIRMQEQTEADINKLCVLSFTTYPENLNTLLKVLKSGVIVDLSSSNVLMNNLTAQNDPKLSDFALLASSGNYTIKVDTFYKTMMTDTAFIKVPVLQKQFLGKTPEQVAQDAVNQLYDLRERRFRLVIGDVDNYPQGDALKIALAELKSQEEQLLSLFAGAKSKTTSQYSFSVVPQTPGTGGTLFYFSESAGFSSQPGNGFREYYYETGKTEIPASPAVDTSVQTRLYYRFPVPTEISIGSSKGTVLKMVIPVYQFGPFGVLPMVEPPVGKR